MRFSKWIQIFLEEKGLSDYTFELTDDLWGVNYIPIDCLLEFMEQVPEFHSKIKHNLVMLDFYNKNTLAYLEHLASGMLKSTSHSQVA